MMMRRWRTLRREWAVEGLRVGVIGIDVRSRRRGRRISWMMKIMIDSSVVASEEEEICCKIS